MQIRKPRVSSRLVPTRLAIFVSDSPNFTSRKPFFSSKKETVTGKASFFGFAGRGLALATRMTLVVLFFAVGGAGCSPHPVHSQPATQAGQAEMTTGFTPFN